MGKSADRLSLLKEARAKLLQEKSKDERVNEMSQFLKRINDFGINNFPFVSDNGDTEGDQR